MRTQVAFLCCCNIAWILYNNTGTSFTCEQFFSMLCYLSTLLYLVRPVQSVSPPPPAAEEAETTLLRKQIQEINWRIMSSKASTLSQIKYVIQGKSERIRRCKSDSRSPSVSRRNDISKLHPWRSWTGPHIPDFHSEDCRNTNISTK